MKQDEIVQKVCQIYCLINICNIFHQTYWSMLGQLLAEGIVLHKNILQTIFQLISSYVLPTCYYSLHLLMVYYARRCFHTRKNPTIYIHNWQWVSNPSYFMKTYTILAILFFRFFPTPWWWYAGDCDMTQSSRDWPYKAVVFPN